VFAAMVLTAGSSVFSCADSTAVSNESSGGTGAGGADGSSVPWPEGVDRPRDRSVRVAGGAGDSDGAGLSSPGGAINPSDRGLGVAGDTDDSGSGGSGTGGSAGTGGAATTGCPDQGGDSWGQPVLVRGDGEVVGTPQVAMSDDGEVVVAWTQPLTGDDGLTEPWARPYSPAGGWGAAESLWAPDVPIRTLRVAVVDEGLAMVLWDSDGPEATLWSAYRDGAAAAWDAPVPMSVWTNTSGAKPELAMDANGLALVTWIESDADPEDETTDALRSNVFTPDGGWDDKVKVELPSEFHSHVLAMNPSGDAVAVWISSDPAVQFGKPLVWSSRSRAGSSWTDAERIDWEGGDDIEPRVAIDLQGDAVAVWESPWWSERIGDVGGRRFTDMSWEDQFHGFGVMSSTAARVGISGAGKVTMAWRQFLHFDGVDPVFAVMAWSFPVKSNPSNWEPVVISGSAQFVGDPEIAVGSGGDVIAVWTQRDPDYDSGTYLVASRYVPGSGWERPEFIEQPSEGDSGSPRVAIDGEGNAIAVWLRSGAGSDDAELWASTFCGSGWSSTSDTGGGGGTSGSGSGIGGAAGAPGGTTTTSAEPSCEPAQWDCSSVSLSCSTRSGASGFRVPESCPCDATRPRSKDDCADGMVFTCREGDQRWDGTIYPRELPFECSCVPGDSDSDCQVCDVAGLSVPPTTSCTFYADLTAVCACKAGVD